MILLVWVPFLAPFLAAPAARRLADALPPRAAAWVLGATGVLLAGATGASLGLLLLGGLLRIPFVAALGHLSLPWLDDVSPVAMVLAALAGTLLVTAGGLTLRTAHHQYSDLRRARAALGPCAEPAGGDAHPLAVLDDDRADAYAPTDHARRNPPARCSQASVGRVRCARVSTAIRSSPRAASC
ncbi:hypothetical protein ACQRUO_20840, partial [Kitasatospora sp. LaBMicrA B282]